jgi:hypothetical protein
MPFQFDLLFSPDMLLIEGEGRLDTGAFGRLVRKIITTPVCRLTSRILIDMRGASIEMPQHALRESMLRLLRDGVLAKRRLAIVPDARAQGHGLARMVAGLVTLYDADARVFADPDEALGWLQEHELPMQQEAEAPPIPSAAIS